MRSYYASKMNELLTSKSDKDKRESRTEIHFSHNSNITGVICFTAADITARPTRTNIRQQCINVTFNLT